MWTKVDAKFVKIKQKCSKFAPLPRVDGGGQPPSWACFKAVFFVRIFCSFKMASGCRNRSYHVISEASVHACDWLKRAHPRLFHSCWSSSERAGRVGSPALCLWALVFHCLCLSFISDFILPLVQLFNSITLPEWLKTIVLSRLLCERHSGRDKSGRGMRDRRWRGLSRCPSWRLLLCRIEF